MDQDRELCGYVWLLGIALNLVTTGMFYDLAMRDVEIAIGAFALTQMTAMREQQATLKSNAKGMGGSQLAETDDAT